MSEAADKIESLVNDFSDSVVDNIVDDNTLVFTAQDAEAARKAREERDAEARLRTIDAKRAADDLVKSAKELYTKTSDIDYIKFKGEADADSLGKIIFQIDVVEDAIRSVSEKISDGDDNPAYHKSLCELERTLLELLKTKNSYLQSIEDSFKQINNDVEMSAAIEVVGEDEGSSLTAKAKNGKDLMRLINEASDRMKKELKNAPQEDAQNLF